MLWAGGGQLANQSTEIRKDVGGSSLLGSDRGQTGGPFFHSNFFQPLFNHP